ncbi:MAG: hypothetical protein JJU21_11595 [Salinarimonas sp.]|nr:hypothetical protein [Salinarimonas sp.]
MALRPNDVTLNSLQETLPVEYVRMVLSRLRDCEQSLGDAYVRVCLNTDIEPPHYCIDAMMDPETGETTNRESFHGKTHKPLTVRQASDVVWAAERMTYSQVSDLIGAMRNFSKKKTAVRRN